MYIAISKWNIDWLIDWLIINYSVTVQPSEGIAEAYSHVGAHNKLSVCQPAMAATWPPSSSEIRVIHMCLLYHWCSGKKYNMTVITS